MISLCKKVGNVPANLAGFFRKCLLHSNYISNITCVSTGLKPRPSVRPRTKPRPSVRPRTKARPSVRPRTKARPSVRPRSKAKFLKSTNGGKDHRGGGLVLNCQYIINLKDPKYRPDMAYEVEKFLQEYDGDEEIAPDL